MNVYLVAAVACLVAVGAAGVQGYRLGRDAEIAANAVRAEDARKDAEERENHNRFLARSEAKNLQVALGRQKGLTNGLNAQLDDALKAAQNVPAGCPAPALGDELRDIWNRANAGSDAAGRSLPSGSGATPPADRPKPSGDGQEPR